MAARATILTTLQIEILQTTWIDHLFPSLQKEERHLRDNPVQDDEEDLCGVGEQIDAIEKSEKIIRALYIVGIFHIFEQHMIDSFYQLGRQSLENSLTEKNEEKNKNEEKKIIDLNDLIDMFRKAWSIDLDKLESWSKINELRWVSNCVKHGEGPSCEKLKKVKPDWFKHPHTGEIELAGFDLEIPPDFLEQAIKDVKNFLENLQVKLKNHPNS